MADPVIDKRPPAAKVDSQLEPRSSPFVTLQQNNQTPSLSNSSLSPTVNIASIQADLATKAATTVSQSAKNAPPVIYLATNEKQEPPTPASDVQEKPDPNGRSWQDAAKALWLTAAEGLTKTKEHCCSFLHSCVDTVAPLVGDSASAFLHSSVDTLASTPRQKPDALAQNIDEDDDGPTGIAQLNEEHEKAIKESECEREDAPALVQAALADSSTDPQKYDPHEDPDTGVEIAKVVQEYGRELLEEKQREEKEKAVSWIVGSAEPIDEVIRDEREMLISSHPAILDTPAVETIQLDYKRHIPFQAILDDARRQLAEERIRRVDFSTHEPLVESKKRIA